MVISGLQPQSGGSLFLLRCPEKSLPARSSSERAVSAAESPEQFHHYGRRRRRSTQHACPKRCQSRLMTGHSSIDPTVRLSVRRIAQVVPFATYTPPDRYKIRWCCVDPLNPRRLSLGGGGREGRPARQSGQTQLPGSALAVLAEPTRLH